MISELGQIYGPPLMETMERYNLGQVVFARAVVPRADTQTLGERAARILAYAHEPLLAVDIAVSSNPQENFGIGPRRSRLSCGTLRRSPR